MTTNEIILLLVIIGLFYLIPTVLKKIVIKNKVDSGWNDSVQGKAVKICTTLNALMKEEFEDYKETYDLNKEQEEKIYQEIFYFSYYKTYMNMVAEEKISKEILKKLCDYVFELSLRYVLEHFNRIDGSFTDVEGNENQYATDCINTYNERVKKWEKVFDEFYNEKEDDFGYIFAFNMVVGEKIDSIIDVKPVKTPIEYGKKLEVEMYKTISEIF